MKIRTEFFTRLVIIVIILTGFTSYSLCYDEIYVFDSKIRRIVLSLEEQKCLYIEYFKDEKGNYTDTTSITLNYHYVGDSMIIFDDNVDSFFTERDTLPFNHRYTSHPSYNKNMNIWDDDDGLPPCLDTMRVMKNKKVEYLFCYKKVEERRKTYNFFFMKTSRKKLRKKKILPKF